MAEERIYNIPNFLSLYRILVFPFVFWLVYSGNENLFALFLCINLVTDVLDGLIARMFHLQTRLGAKLDSLGDIGTYILAFYGIFSFKTGEIGGDIWLLYCFLGFYLISQLVSFIKFKTFPSLHLYSFKIAGYLQGICFFVIFAFSYFHWMFIIAMGWGILANLDEFLVILLINEMRPDLKGSYWLIKNRNG